MKTIKILVLSIFLTLASHVFSQKHKKIYYDEKWKTTTNSNAPFYRLISYDKNDRIIGNVKDYYASGELQMELEPISIDKSDDSKSKWKKKIGYYKSGRKEICENYDANGNLVETINWEDKKITSFSYFESVGLNQIEEFALIHSNNYFNDIVAGKDMYNFYIDFKKAQNEVGGDSFTLYDIESKNIIGEIVYAKQQQFMAVWFRNNEMVEVEKELANKGFKVISEIAEKNEETGKILTMIKWGKENHPLRYILQYPEKEKSNGYIVLVSNISPQF